MNVEVATRTASLPGRTMPPDKLRQLTIEHCRHAIRVAGHCRKSGNPHASVMILSGVVPVLVETVHRALVDGQRQQTIVSMIEDIRVAGYVEGHAFALIRQAVNASHANASCRDVRNMMRGAYVLLAMTSLEKAAAPTPTKRRWSIVGRVAATFSGLFASS